MEIRHEEFGMLRSEVEVFRGTNNVLYVAGVWGYFNVYANLPAASVTIICNSGE